MNWPTNRFNGFFHVRQAVETAFCHAALNTPLKRGANKTHVNGCHSIIRLSIKRWREFPRPEQARSVVECSSPLELFPSAVGAAYSWPTIPSHLPHREKLSL
jgi:hypothetical protein